MEWHKTRSKEWYDNKHEVESVFGFSLPVSAQLSMITSKIEIDIFKLEKVFTQCNPEFNPDECTYKGEKGYSTYKFVEERYGKRTKELLEKII